MAAPAGPFLTSYSLQWALHIQSISGLCSNALAFASANAAFALAFDSPVTAVFALAFAFDSSAFAFALAFDSNAIDWNQMRNKCESNATV